MKSLILPFDINDIDNNGIKPSIDMSKTNFIKNDKEKENEKIKSFIFLRNMGIKDEDFKLDFSNCSYEDKEEFLLLYLNTDIDVTAEILASTWIEILSAKDGGGVILPSIFTSNEIEKFLGRNEKLISELYSIINSLPIYSMIISDQNGKMYDINDFKKSDYNGIKMINFSKLTRFDEFSLLIDGSTEPIFYKNLFVDNQYMREINSNLPFSNLLNALSFTTEEQNKLVDGINNILIPPVINSGD